MTETGARMRIVLGIVVVIVVALVFLVVASQNSNTRLATPRPTSTHQPLTVKAAEAQPPVAPPVAPTSPTTITLTLYGTNASFTWTTGSGNIHQLQEQNGPYVIELPWSTFDKTTINANVMTTSADAGCKATWGDHVIVDNTAPGQTFASCLERF